RFRDLKNGIERSSTGGNIWRRFVSSAATHLKPARPIWRHMRTNFSAN
ncbi:hypothetical protein RCH06_003618, partial [Polaromonas sp. CG_9.5]|nr:hypothetical protein [Polaromonas sp. CG_9.5]